MIVRRFVRFEREPVIDGARRAIGGEAFPYLDEGGAPCLMATGRGGVAMLEQILGGSEAPDLVVAAEAHAAAVAPELD